MSQNPTTPSTVTFTGTVGAGVSVTSFKFNNVLRFDLDFAKACGHVYDTSPTVHDIPLDGLSTFTATIASGVATITLS
jgi:hypothetical protein